MRHVIEKANLHRHSFARIFWRNFGKVLRQLELGKVVCMAYVFNDAAVDDLRLRNQ